MLTKIEIDSQYYKLSKHLINRDEGPVNTSDRSLSFLINETDERVVAIGTHPMSCKSLATFDKQFVPHLFDSSNNSIVNINIRRNECWHLQGNRMSANHQWKENYNIQSIEELNGIMLVNQKVCVLDKIYQNIDYARNLYKESLINQNFVYLSKYLEAKEILEKNIQTDDTLKYPYTTGYAKLKDFTLQEAASSIVLQYENISGFFAESENIRIKYKDLVLKEKELSNLKYILENFLVENARYANI